jgi:hypothetical protein
VKILRAVCPTFVLTCLASDHIGQYVKNDHCVERGQSPVYSAEISLLHPNDSIHEYVSSTTGRIPEIVESSFECSDYVQYCWTDNDVLQGYGGSQSFEPLGIQDDLFPNRDSCVQYDNLAGYVDSSLFTIQDHKPLNYSPSVISQSTSEALAQSQSFLDLIYTETQHTHSDSRPMRFREHIPSTLYTEPTGERQESEPHNFNNLSYPASLHLSSSQSASPASNGQVSSDAPSGKMEIAPAGAKHVCPTCRESFASDLRYRKHRSALSCQTQYLCHDCERKFKNAKDLQRHRGHTKADSSCPKLKAVASRVKSFACTCNLNAYTRKDSLLRHFREHAGIDPQSHRCRACDHAPCSCPSERRL